MKGDARWEYGESLAPNNKGQTRFVLFCTGKALAFSKQQSFGTGSVQYQIRTRPVQVMVQDPVQLHGKYHLK
jgi:hypothetical protein